MNKSEYNTYIDALQFLINGRRQNLCWLMSYCSIDRNDKWRDKQLNKIQSDIDGWNAELQLVQREAVKIDS